LKDRILIVDDDRQYIAQLAELLEDEGLEVGFATNGSDALKMVQAVLYDIIILDINMPRMSGLDVLKELKESKSTKMVPVLMSTGESDKETVVTAIKLGADDYIVKPIDSNVLFDKLYVLLKIRSFVKRWGVLPN